MHARNPCAGNLEHNIPKHDHHVMYIVRIDQSLVLVRLTRDWQYIDSIVCCDIESL